MHSWIALKSHSFWIHFALNEYLLCLKGLWGCRKNCVSRKEEIELAEDSVEVRTEADVDVQVVGPRFVVISRLSFFVATNISAIC